MHCIVNVMNVPPLLQMAGDVIVLYVCVSAVVMTLRRSCRSFRKAVGSWRPSWKLSWVRPNTGSETCI